MLSRTTRRWISCPARAAAASEVQSEGRYSARRCQPMILNEAVDTRHVPLP